ncbi:hypothetical protein ABH940_003634 [Streptacidiphilus sp. BW17]
MSLRFPGLRRHGWKHDRHHDRRHHCRHGWGRHGR